LESCTWWKGISSSLAHEQSITDIPRVSTTSWGDIGGGRERGGERERKIERGREEYERWK